MTLLFWIAAVLIALISGWSLFQSIVSFLEILILLQGMIWKRVEIKVLFRLILKRIVIIAVYSGLLSGAYILLNRLREMEAFPLNGMLIIGGVFILYLSVQLPHKLMLAWQVSVTPEFLKQFEQENRFLVQYSRKQNYF